MRSKPEIKLWGKYRNCAGQIRQVVGMTGKTVDFRVLDPGPNNNGSSLLTTQTYRNLATTFRGWVYQEVE